MMTVDESIIKICEEDFRTNKEHNSPKQNKMPMLPSTNSESRLPSLLNIQQICSHSQRGIYIYLINVKFHMTSVKIMNI